MWGYGASGAQCVKPAVLQCRFHRIKTLPTWRRCGSKYTKDATMPCDILARSLRTASCKSHGAHGGLREKKCKGWGKACHDNVSCASRRVSRDPFRRNFSMLGPWAGLVAVKRVEVLTEASLYGVIESGNYYTQRDHWKHFDGKQKRDFESKLSLLRSCS